jgi:hypothetical protein
MGGRTHHRKEAVMNPARAIGRLARILASLATAVLAVNAATAAALATPRPRPPGWNKHPPQPASTQPASKPLPGWNKHPPLPGHIHAVVTGGMPGWQIALVAIIGVVLVAAVHAPRPSLGTRRKTGIRGAGIDNESLRPLLDGALASEPTIGPVAQNALAVGIRLRRRRIRLPLP